MAARDQDAFEIECLACGRRRLASGSSRDELGMCPDCGYVGWAFPWALADGDRQRLRRTLGASWQRDGKPEGP